MDELKNFIIDRETRTVYWYTGVTCHISLAITKFINRVNVLSSSDTQPIRIYINSLGGDTDGLLGLVQVMLSSKVPIYTYCMGVAASAAFIIFISGHTRTMVYGSRLVWHTIGSRSTSSDISSFRQRFELTMDDQDTYDNIVASRTNIPMADLADLRNKSGIESEMWLSTTEAEKYGCTDVIYKY